MALSKNEMGWSHPDLNALAAFIDHRLSEADRARGHHAPGRMLRVSCHRRGTCARSGLDSCSGREAGGPQVPLAVSPGGLAPNRGNPDARDHGRVGGVAHRPRRTGASLSLSRHVSEPARPNTGNADARDA